MAEKKVPLSIVISAVDKATAAVRAVNDRISRITSKVSAPLSMLREKLSGLANEAGLPKLIDGFKGVGSALKEVAGKAFMIGGAVVSAGLGLKSLVDGFDDMGDLAERIGVGVDFLAQMRYAAERSGASVEQLDSGLQTFSQNIGQARAGTGKMSAFLKLVSPALLTQLKAAKSNEQAFGLMADAMAKITDPAKRLALAQKAVGDSALAPLLARGADGIDELRKRYAELAGSQNGAASAAGAVDDSMKDLKAATDGIKAALVEGLAPALGQIVEELRAWFAENRAQVAAWAAALGKKLPAAIHKFAGAFLGALDTVGGVLDSLGGIRTVAIALAAVIVGPLVASIYSLGVAILTTPVGWIMAAIAAIAAGVYAIIKNWAPIKAFFGRVWEGIKSAFSAGFEFVKGIFLRYTPIGQVIAAWQPISAFFSSLWDGITAVFEAAWQVIKKVIDKVTGAVDSVVGAVSSVGDAVGSAIDFINPFSGDEPSISAKAADVVMGKSSSQAKITVDFANAPKGMRVSSEQRGGASVDLSVGYQMMGMP
jgi:hypothetical protein